MDIAENRIKSMIRTVFMFLFVVVAMLLASCTTSKGSFTDGMYIQGGVGTTIRK